MEDIKRDAFVFYRSYYEAIQELSDQDQLRAYKAIFDYALNGTEPTLTGVPAAVFMLVKPTLEISRRKAASGRAGGKARSKTEANGKQTESKSETIKDKGHGIKDKRQGISDPASPTSEDAVRSLSIDYQGVIDIFNRVCTALPKVKALTEQRRKAIKALYPFVEENGGFNFFFARVQASDFLSGRSENNWSACFDWIFKRSNAAKIFEGNYDNRGENKNGCGNKTPDYTDASRYENTSMEVY